VRKISSSKKSSECAYNRLWAPPTDSRVFSHQLLSTFSAHLSSAGLGLRTHLPQGEWGLKNPFCGKCDVIFSYIYTNTTKLVFHISYLVRLDCFYELLLQIAILAQICIKMRSYYRKIAKNLPALFAPRPPAFGSWWRSQMPMAV